MNEEQRETLARAHAYYCTHAPVSEADRLTVRYLLEVADAVLDRVGNDGLTDAERAAHAENWRNGAGRTPSKEEMKRLRTATPARAALAPENARPE